MQNPKNTMPCKDLLLSEKIATLEQIKKQSYNKSQCRCLVKMTRVLKSMARVHSNFLVVTTIQGGAEKFSA